MRLALLVRQRAPAEHRDVGLGLAVVRQNNAALDIHQGPASQATEQQLTQVEDEGLVAAANGRHREDLALDQLDAIVFAEDAGLGHPVVLLPRESPSWG